MILIIDALNKAKFSSILEDMFRLRARVFGGRLGWEVNIKDGMEIDEFDRLDPAYVVGLDEEGNVVSAVRALQTTGPHMLSDVFHAILNGEPPIRSASMWESTRFCVDTQRLTRGKERNSISYATSELMIGSLEYARNAGIKDIVTVIDPIMDRVLKRSDCAPYDYVGVTAPMGKVSALAALLDCTPERIENVRNFSNIHHDVFLDEDTVLNMLEARKEKIKSSAQLLDFPGKPSVSEAPAEEANSKVDIGAYCEEQIKDAKTLEERKAALALKEALSGMQASPRHCDA